MSEVFIPERVPVPPVRREQEPRSDATQEFKYSKMTPEQVLKLIQRDFTADENTKKAIGKGDYQVFQRGDKVHIALQVEGGVRNFIIILHDVNPVYSSKNSENTGDGYSRLYAVKFYLVKGESVKSGSEASLFKGDPDLVKKLQQEALKTNSPAEYLNLKKVENNFANNLPAENPKLTYIMELNSLLKDPKLPDFAKEAVQRVLTELEGKKVK